MDEQIEQLKKDVEKTSSGRGGFGWGILGFFIPIVGIVLFFVWRKNNKKSSKAAGIGALIGVIISVILTVIYFVWLGSFLLGYNPEPKNDKKKPVIVDKKDDDKKEDDKKEVVEVTKTIEGTKPNGEKITLVYNAKDYDVTLTLNGKTIEGPSYTPGLYVEGEDYNKEIKVTGYDKFAIIDLDSMDTCGPDTHMLIIATYDGTVLYDTSAIQKKYDNVELEAYYRFNGNYTYNPTNNTLSVTYQYSAAGECSFPDYLVRKEQESDSEFCSRIKGYKDVYNTIIISYSGLGSENLFKLDEEYTTISKDGYLSKYFENCNY